MLKTLRSRDKMVRILLGFVMGLIALMMVITLVPGFSGPTGDPATAVATVGNQEITMNDVQRQLQRISGQRQIPRALQGLYARQIMDQLVFEKVLEQEADRLGIRVTDEERAERIKRLLPIVFSGDTFLGMDRYTLEVSQRFQMTVPEFEDIIRMSLLEEKFRRLVTDGIRVAPEEVQQEFKRRNEKVKLDYVLIQPTDLEAKIAPSEADLSAYFEKNKGRYQLPERRVARYVLLDSAQLSQRVSVTDDELRAYYTEHIDRYRVQNRAKVSHILFKTVGKTDAEVEEIRKKAQDVLNKAKKGAKFEDLAKQNSEDPTKEKGGDLGWIVQGQTVPEFEKAAFTLPKGTISDLVKTEYGFHIIRVDDRETARTMSFEEVRGTIAPVIAAEKADRVASEASEKLAAGVRRGSSRPIEEFAKEFSLPVSETRPVAAGEPIAELGARNNELDSELFRLNQGQLSMPIKVDRGYAVISVKEIQPARQGQLADVRDRVSADFRREKSVELARTRAEDLAKRVQGGEALPSAAKALGLEMKSSELFARTGSIPAVGSGKQLASAFSMSTGQTSAATLVGANWIIYRVAQKEEAKPEEFEKQKKELEQALLSQKRGTTYEAFRSALQEKFRKEGKLRVNEQNMRRLMSPA